LTRKGPMKLTSWCLAAVAVASLVAAPSGAQPVEGASEEIGAYLDRLEAIGRQ